MELLLKKHEWEYVGKNTPEPPYKIMIPRTRGMAERNRIIAFGRHGALCDPDTITDEMGRPESIFTNEFA